MTQTLRSDSTDPISLARAADGQLVLWREDTPIRVRAVRCFPWSAPLGHVSLRDDDDQEVALVRDPGELGAEARQALEKALDEAGLVLEIERILELEEDFELRCWKVVTRQGVRSFQTPRDAWPRETPGGAQLIEDVHGDVFRLPEAERLDPISRKLLFAFLD